MGRSVEGFRLRRKIVNLRRKRSEARHLRNGLRRDATDTFQKTEGVESLEAHGFEFFAEAGDGNFGEFVGGLFGNAKDGSDFAVGLAIPDAFHDLNKSW